MVDIGICSTTFGRMINVLGFLFESLPERRDLSY
jgi:hypothetical protein